MKISFCCSHYLYFVFHPYFLFKFIVWASMHGKGWDFFLLFISFFLFFIQFTVMNAYAHFQNFHFHSDIFRTKKIYCGKILLRLLHITFFFCGERKYTASKKNFNKEKEVNEKMRHGCCLIFYLTSGYHL